MLQNAQTVAAQLELVRPGLPVAYEREGVLYSRLQKGEKYIVSSRNARIPLQSAPGGNVGYYSPDGGDMGTGSGTNYDYGQVTPIPIRFGVQISKEVEYVTQTSEQAIANIAKNQVSDAMEQFPRDMDTFFQTAGNGVLATITAVNGNTITLADTPFGARLVRAQQVVQVYSSDLATNRGSFTIQNDPQNGLGQVQQVTADAVPGGTIATDVLVVGGVSGASPVFLYGLPYHINNSTSGSWEGISRTNPYVVSNAVALAGAGLTMPPVRLLKNQIKQLLGKKSVAGGLVWHLHGAQIQAYEELGLLVSVMQQDQGRNKKLDLLFDQDNMRLDGLELMENIHADITRLDLVNFNLLGRVEWQGIDFFRIGGNTVFPMYGGSGGLIAAYIFYLVTAVQMFCVNPRGFGAITGAGTPAGYTS